MAYANIPSNPDWQSYLRCASNSPNGQFHLVGTLLNKQIAINTPVGEVLSRLAPAGGQWDFFCNPDDDYPEYRNSGLWALSHSLISAWPWEGDPTVCLLPHIRNSGMGMRFFDQSGNTVRCGAAQNETSTRFFKIKNGGITQASYDGVFAEIVRIGTIPPGTYTLPMFALYADGIDKLDKGGSSSQWRLSFIDGTFEAANCFMAGHNQIIDFGERVKSAEVFSKPFDITLTGCDGQDLVDFKASASLSFASNNMNGTGTGIVNCSDSDCADGAYITFTDLAGGAVDLTADYSFNAQPSNDPNRLSFNANLHTENAGVGKIETSLTLIVTYN
ncbi:fimbrial protein [Shewanella sp. MBTL60-007]|uniref:fimbrial protein n=1 Tax=Shewanella sp. MBTL60-007 TaxID=2815911 RepID=UPI001C8177EC|nr:hypothetical protein [Shewanella sp. MBTL60-007]